jgi:hypothetical protein
MRADVLPLLEYTAQGDARPTRLAVIANIPVLFIYAGGYYVRHEYARGDIVWVTYATFDITKALSGGFDSADGSIFSRENAAVLSGLASKNFNVPDFDKNGLLIGHKDGAAYSQYLSDKMIHKFGDTEIIVSQSGIQINFTGINIELSTAGVKVITPGGTFDLSNHTHGTPVGPSSPTVPY